jgi:hypothetical protein
VTADALFAILNDREVKAYAGSIQVTGRWSTRGSDMPCLEPRDATKRQALAHFRPTSERP